MKEMQSRTKMACVTYGLSSAPSGGTAMPMNTSAAMARVPWPPIQHSARTGSVIAVCRGGDIRLPRGKPLQGRKYRSGSIGCEHAAMARPGKVTSRYLVLPYRVLLRALSKIAYPQRFARKPAVVSWHLKQYL